MDTKKGEKPRGREKSNREYRNQEKVGRSESDDCSLSHTDVGVGVSLSRGVHTDFGRQVKRVRIPGGIAGIFGAQLNVR